MADWLRLTRVGKPKPDARTLLAQRYPTGLFNEAELEALLKILND